MVQHITVVEKKQVWLVGGAIPGESKIEQNKLEKFTKDQDLKVEVERLWGKKATVVPVRIGALGKIQRPTALELNTIKPSHFQIAALLGTAHILRKFL